MDKKSRKSGTTTRRRKTATRARPARKRRGSDWRSKRFPGVDDFAKLEKSFAILNDWARALQRWESRIRAMCGILQLATGVNEEQFERVVRSIDRKKHSPRDFAGALRRGGYRVGGFIPATDVLGHPPNPPYTDDSLPPPQ